MAERSTGRPGPATTIANTVEETARPPEIDLASFGYEILEEIGHGGLGRIVRARDGRLGREVALKIPIDSSADALLRLMREARITARLQHPSIVPIYEAGTLPDGRPFYAMKLVEGETLRSRVEAAATLEQRLALLPHAIAVSEAIAYAHSRRTIHRDLKPANVLAGAYGETIVLDWGLAIGLDEPPGPLDEGVSGTPSWMAPEQADGKPCDERSDVFALGLLLWHLLTGRSPYDGDTRERVLEAAKRAEPLPLPKGAPEDLVAIVRRATRRDPAERYPDGAAVAADLRRYLTGQLVSSRVYSRLELLLRWAKRHRAPIAVGALGIASLAAVGGVSVERIRRARNQAEARRDRLLLAQAESALGRDPTEALGWLEERIAVSPLRPADAILAGDLAAEAESAGVARWVIRDVADAAMSPRGAIAATLAADCTLTLRDLDTGATTSLAGGAPPCSSLSFSPDGARVAARFRGDIGVWETATGRTVHAPHVKALTLGPGVLRWSPAGDGLVATSGSDLVLYDGSGEQVRQLHVVGAPPEDAAFSPDGRTIATAQGEQLWLRPVRGPDPEMPVEGLAVPIRLMRWMPDGSGIVLGGGDGKVTRVVTGGDAEVIAELDSAVAAIDVGRGSDVVAAAAQDGAFVVWSRALDAVHTRGTGPGGVRSLVLASNGERVWIGGTPGLEEIDFRTGDYTDLLGHRDAIERVELSGDRSWLLSLDRSGIARVWRLGAWSGTRMTRIPFAVSELAFAPGGRQIAALGSSASLGLCEPGKRDCTAWGPWGGPGGELRAMAWLSSGAGIVTGSEDGIVRVWDTTGGWVGKPMREHDGEVTRVAVSPVSGVIASAASDGVVLLWDRAHDEVLAASEHGDAVSALAWAPDGSRLVSGDRTGAVRVTAADGSGIATLAGHTGAVTAIAFPADATIATAGADGTVRVWSAPAGADARVFSPGLGPLSALLVAGPHAVIAAGTRGAARIDLESGASRPLPGRAGVSAIAVSANGLVAAGGSDRVIRLWDPATGATGAERLPAGGTEAVTALAFSPDGSTLAAADGAGSVVTFPIAPLAPSSDLGARLDALTTARVAADGGLRSP